MSPLGISTERPGETERDCQPVQKQQLATLASSVVRRTVCVRSVGYRRTAERSPENQTRGTIINALSLPATRYHGRANDPSHAHSLFRCCSGNAFLFVIFVSSSFIIIRLPLAPTRSRIVDKKSNGASVLPRTARSRSLRRGPLRAI